MIIASEISLAQTVTEFKTGITQDVYPPIVRNMISGPNGNLWFGKVEGNSWTLGQLTTAGAPVNFRAAETQDTIGPLGMLSGPDGKLWLTSVGGDAISLVTPTGIVTKISAGIPQGSSPTYMVTGPDGNVWVSLQNLPGIAKVTPQGGVTLFTTGITAGSKPIGITVGADGNIWFAEYYAFKIGRLTPNGTVTEFPVGPFPRNLLKGIDGKLWFTTDVSSTSSGSYVYFQSDIWRMNTTGITEFVATVKGTSRPAQAVVLPNGNYCFSATDGDKIVCVSPTKAVTEYTSGISAGSGPTAIDIGSDGNLWFAEPLLGKLAKISPNGISTEYSVGQGSKLRLAEPSHAALGADGNLWAILAGTNKIARVDPSGAIAEFSDGLRQYTKPISIARGSDGNVWFSQQANFNGDGAICKITPTGVVTTYRPPDLSFFQPVELTAGKDGKMWYSDDYGRLGNISTDGNYTQIIRTSVTGYRSGVATALDGSIWSLKYRALVRVSPAGTISEFPLVGGNAGQSITSGPDGNIWFATYNPDTSRGLEYWISKVTPAGEISNYSIGRVGYPYRARITGGPDGNVWFHLNDNLIGKVTPFGRVSIYKPPFSTGAAVSDIVQGADGNFWLPLSGVDAIAKMTLPAEPVVGDSRSQTFKVRTSSAQLLSASWQNNRIQLAPIADPGAGVRVVASVDLNGDAVDDLVFQDLTAPGEFGDVRFWRNGIASGMQSLRTVKRVWGVQAVGDLDGDGFGDLVWRYLLPGTNDTGVSYIWFTNGNSVSQVRKRGGAPLDWQLLGAVDVNGDGAADLIYISPSQEIRVLIATANRTCANFSVDFTLPSVSTKVLAVGNLGFYPGTQIKRAAVFFADPENNQVRVLSLDGRGINLPPPTGNPDDPNASCTATSTKIPATFTVVQNIVIGPTYQYYSAVDLNGDGVTDLIWRSMDNSLSVLLLTPTSSALNWYPNAGTLPN